ncbi:hypothetical protein WALSEDRAFT_61266 [Wallemia mellicola CBS 633.66]|uniref:G-protein coupled receptors family 2 profile 2 domain-containing protein n=1 Tax=Wallemia mellicola (strain ATCC MYA-4683 / CBS 633.66) TaxID=671144 RepID=I4Y7J6_WALMC|nr:hypothetical protein WALSEDRAFT_61266 [Wallemia mellicola CBS 633.66]EIM19938.1 hypothetical protein WALSEDRAFT_61266 [Wallemia mellicola CBS 633.66]|eukprot:XP_006960077.1 hypothetical protein WALSEDRAFT_61266 [Wallemia mellicola CBS 633.66]
MALKDVPMHSPAPSDQLAAYYSLILIGCFLHIVLFFLGLFHRIKNKNMLLLLNFHFLFALTLWFDSILLWTGHAHSFTDEIPKGIRAVNVAFRLAGMIQNASSSWMIALQMLISINVVNFSTLGHYTNYISIPMLVGFPWIIGIPFFVSHLYQALEDPENTYRTPFFADQTDTYLTRVSIITTLVLMILLLITVICVGYLLLKLRLSQRNLVKVSWFVHLQLASRVLFFSYYSITVIIVLSLTVNFNDFEPAKQIVFATSGLAAAIVFLVENENINLMFKILRTIKRRCCDEDDTTCDSSQTQKMAPDIRLEEYNLSDSSPSSPPLKSNSNIHNIEFVETPSLAST